MNDSTQTENTIDIANMRSYDRYRYEKLEEWVDDILSDEDADLNAFYDFLITKIEDWEEYHQRRSDSIRSLRQKMENVTKIIPEVQS